MEGLFFATLQNMKRQNWPAGLEFVKTELELGSTFAGLALSSKDRARIVRNQANARLAYDTASRYVAWVLLTPVESQDLKRRFKLLRGQLVSMGDPSYRLDDCALAL